jgi:D-alanyl-D-alanine dipeptidase
LLALRIVDNREPFADVSTLAALAVDNSRTDVQKLSDDPFQVRSEVAARLVRAQAYLPAGYKLQLKEGWRPIWVQEHLWQVNLDRLRARRPNLTEEELHQENARAVDVVLLHRADPADMGWGFNQPGEGASTAYPATGPARRHRGHARFRHGHRRLRELHHGVVALVLRRPILGLPNRSGDNALRPTLTRVLAGFGRTRPSPRPVPARRYSQAGNAPGTMPSPSGIPSAPAPAGRLG